MNPLPIPKPEQSLEAYIQDAVLAWYQAGVRGEELTDLMVEYAAEDMARKIKPLTSKYTHDKETILDAGSDHPDYWGTGYHPEQPRESIPNLPTVRGTGAEDSPRPRYWRPPDKRQGTADDHRGQ